VIQMNLVSLNSWSPVPPSFINNLFRLHLLYIFNLQHIRFRLLFIELILYYYKYNIETKKYIYLPY
jgi:hypothetical protein